MPERATEEVEDDVDRDRLELEDTLELDVDDRVLDIEDVEVEDSVEVEELDWDDEVEIFELEELVVDVVDVEAFDAVVVVPDPEGGAIA